MGFLRIIKSKTNKRRNKTTKRRNKTNKRRNKTPKRKHKTSKRSRRFTKVIRQYGGDYNDTQQQQLKSILRKIELPEDEIKEMMRELNQRSWFYTLPYEQGYRYNRFINKLSQAIDPDVSMERKRKFVRSMVDFHTRFAEGAIDKDDIYDAETDSESNESNP